MSPSEYKDTLRRYLPELAVEPVYHYLTQEHQVKFVITRERTSKHGDYRWPQKGHPYHQITVGGNLPPNFFLMVLLHEMAHLDTRLAHGDRVRPHGHEWQAAYAALLRRYAPCFPPEAQPLLARYTRRIPLHGPTGQELERLLRGNSGPLVRDLAPGSTFFLPNHPDRLFRLIERRRTRFLCQCLDDDQLYTLSGTAQVVPLD